MTLELLDREAKLGMWYLFGRPKKALQWMRKENGILQLLFFST